MPGWRNVRKDPAYGRSAWTRAREACLRRANWKCEIRLAGCQGAASQADHIDGLANDPQHRNLRAACKSCHGKVTADQGNAAKRAQNDPQPRPRTNW